MSDEEIKKKPENNPFPTWIIVLVPVIVLMVWGANFIAAIIFASLNSQTYGQFGDIFGVSNSLIAGLALFLVALGVYFQKQELEKTKELLEEQSKITAAQEAALKKQNQTTERQMFENTLFKLIENSHQTLLNVDDKVNSLNETTRKIGIYALNRIIEKTYFFKSEKKQPTRSFRSIPTSKEDWIIHLSKSETALLVRCGNHMRNLSTNINFVFSSLYKNEDLYYEIVLNSIANVELVLFAYFCVLSSDEEMIEIINTKQLLRNLNFIEDKQSLSLFYNYKPNAFGISEIPERFEIERMRTSPE